MDAQSLGSPGPPRPAGGVPALPGDIRQIGYVVRDLDVAMADWLRLGVGPWHVVRGHRQTGLYRDAPCTVTLSLAFANSGDLQVELIHQDDDTPSVYGELLDGAGPHQFAWWVTDFEATIRAAKAAGWPVVWSGGDEGSTRYAYLEPPNAPVRIVEVMELTPVSRGMAALVREASAEWDGADPIRPLG